MTFWHIPLIHDNYIFRLSRFSGALYSMPLFNRVVDTPSFGEGVAKINRASDFCNDPYKFNPVKRRNLKMSKPIGCKGHGRAMDIANRVVKNCKHQFFLATISASFRKPLFDSSEDAIAFFRVNVDGDQSSLCLPRALYAAKTSRKFKEEGVVFIGVFLPSRSMHAWVVEGDALADPDDDIWINYRPIAAIA